MGFGGDASVDRDESRTSPVVALLCPNTWGFRNLVQSDLVANLRSRGVEPCLLIPESAAARALNYLTDTERCAPMLHVRPKKRQYGKAFGDAVLAASFARQHGLQSYRIFDQWYGRNRSRALRARQLVVDGLSRVGSWPRVFDGLVRCQERRLRSVRDLGPVHAQLRSLAPALLVSTVCVAPSEMPYILSAKDLSIRTLACILSFDNLTTRGGLPVFDYYAVWNTRMRDQLLRFYPRCAPSSVYITGTPQFDFHKRLRFRWSREDTLRRLGLNSTDRYIVYGANSAQFTPTEPRLVRALVEGMTANSQLRGHRVVVRVHPLDPTNRWEGLAKEETRIVISHSWNADLAWGGSDDQALLVNTLRFADVCVNVASSLSLDAAVVDTPVVCVAFAVGDEAERRFCRDAYSTEHYSPLVVSGGVRVAASMEQLVSEVEAYVQERSRDAETRRQLCQQECGEVDGMGAERVAALIERIAREPFVENGHFRGGEGEEIPGSRGTVRGIAK
jgi:hypothetical protein